jgi:hypothetical protein
LKWRKPPRSSHRRKFSSSILSSTGDKSLCVKPCWGRRWHILGMKLFPQRAPRTP